MESLFPPYIRLITNVTDKGALVTRSQEATPLDSYLVGQCMNHGPKNS